VITPSLEEGAVPDGEVDERYAFNGGDVKPTGGILRGSLDDDPGEDARNFRFEQDRGAEGGVRRVKPDVYDDGEWDPDSILALGRKSKQAVKGEDVKAEVKRETSEAGTAAGETLSGAVDSGDGTETQEAKPAEGAVKKEDDAAESKPSGSSMFKKRKAPGAANRSVRQKM
jgi:hypothetical protein